MAKPPPMDSYLTAQHRIAISFVITVAAAAERLVQDGLLAVATGIDSHSPRDVLGTGLAVVAGMEARVILKAVFREKHPESADQMDKLLDGISKGADTRNIVAHAIWYQGKRPGSIATTFYKTSGKYRTGRHEYTVAELHAAAERLHLLCRALLALFNHHGYMKIPEDLPEFEDK